jgi:hypothetical protein
MVEMHSSMKIQKRMENVRQAVVDLAGVIHPAKNCSIAQLLILMANVIAMKSVYRPVRMVGQNTTAYLANIIIIKAVVFQLVLVIRL